MWRKIRWLNRLQDGSCLVVHRSSFSCLGSDAFSSFLLLLVEVVGVVFGSCAFAFLLLDARSEVADEGKGMGKVGGAIYTSRSTNVSR